MPPLPDLPPRPNGGGGGSARPQLRGAQTEDFNHHQAGPSGDLSVDEQTAVLQAMNLESPPGYVESPGSYATDPGRQGTGLPSSASAPTAPSKEKSSALQAKLKTALQEAKYLAGGLMSHPYESTKHYTMLRHSHGLVYYSGPYTNLAITIFSDRELPADRTLWLQRKGFSGKTGLKVGALMGARSTWIDVTPTIRATPDQLNPNDERAWQRDIKKFLKHAPKDIQSHRVRETDILRIPSDADDGYLRVVLCTAQGKKVLCGSPIFRLASSSTDVSSLRGASLTTMPLEIGMKIASVVANNTVTATLSPVADTARGFVSDQVTQVYQPGFIAQEAMTTAYDSEVQTRIDNMNEQYDQARDGSYSRLEQDTYDALARPDIIGDDTGPAAPFPVRFHGRVVPGTGRSKALLNIPTANLTGVPEDILWRYKGVFFGWAAVNLANRDKKSAMPKEGSVSEQWHKAIIIISPDPAKRRTVVDKNTVRVYVMHDFQAASLLDAKLSLIMTGYLRAAPELPPGQEPDVDAQLFDFYKDIAITTASLSRPAWSAEAILEGIKTAASSRSLTERYVDLRQSTQKHLDRVPLHKLGVRTEGAALKDRLVGQGGVWVPRQPQGLAHASTA
ncbi:hypothetical protein A1O3_05361 [Capronia epimyces CBS 606.96]|uniref:Riboflavin kinase n=1 Tax=Capronia epimyces CBS 606.96 TaxID=1182542 RepID=W9Y635_9EURO|nr:uncharacterized protein A1O3_05361 [Capronia epimyces CBS 606.96]EXJ84691.1 hypothetical protein A1O3_05361 [Capronia epimyces CBS 606.96]